MTKAIHFEGVHKHFAGHVALRDIHLRVGLGEMLFLTGPSGAGKSTLLKLLLCMEKPTRGRIYYNNRNLNRYGAKQVAAHRQHTGTILQTPTFIPQQTVQNNLALPLVLAGMRYRDIEQRVQTLLHKVGLEDRAQALPAMLSAGEQQRLNIARAVIHRPALIVADEPTGNLDPTASARIFDLFKSFNEVGVTVIIATHDLNLIAALPYRIISLRAGRLIGRDEQPQAGCREAVLP